MIHLFVLIAVLCTQMIGMAQTGMPYNPRSNGGTITYKLYSCTVTYYYSGVNKGRLDIAKLVDTGQIFTATQCTEPRGTVKCFPALIYWWNAFVPYAVSPNGLWDCITQAQDTTGVVHEYFGELGNSVAGDTMYPGNTESPAEPLLEVSPTVGEDWELNHVGQTNGREVRGGYPGNPNALRYEGYQTEYFTFAKDSPGKPGGPHNYYTGLNEISGSVAMRPYNYVWALNIGQVAYWTTGPPYAIPVKTSGTYTGPGWMYWAIAWNNP